MTLSLHPRPLILTALTAFVAAVIIVVIILPTLHDIRTLNERIRSHRKGLEILYRQGQNLRSSVEEYEKVKQDTPLITSSVLMLGEELQFITALEDIAARHAVQQIINLDTSQTSPSSPNLNSSYRRVVLRLDLQGTAPQLLAMLHDLESLPAYINILNLSFSSNLQSVPLNPAESTHPLISASITAATYWRVSDGN
jgi:hypothetical protein